MTPKCFLCSWGSLSIEMRNTNVTDSQKQYKWEADRIHLCCWSAFAPVQCGLGRNEKQGLLEAYLWRFFSPPEGDDEDLKMLHLYVQAHSNTILAVFFEPQPTYDQKSLKLIVSIVLEFLNKCFSVQVTIKVFDLRAVGMSFLPFRRNWNVGRETVISPKFEEPRLQRFWF